MDFTLTAQHRADDRPPSRNERGGGVEQHHVAAGNFLPDRTSRSVQHCKRRLRGDFVNRGALQAEFLGRHFVAPNLSFAHFGDTGEP